MPKNSMKLGIGQYQKHVSYAQCFGDVCGRQAAIILTDHYETGAGVVFSTVRLQLVTKFQNYTAIVELGSQY
jgi:hypothetical protein